MRILFDFPQVVLTQVHYSSLLTEPQPEDNRGKHLAGSGCARHLSSIRDIKGYVFYI